MTPKEAIKNIVLGFIFIGTPLIVGIFIGEFVRMLAFYGIFGGVNVIHELTKRKLHAESVFNIHEKIMCFICTNLILFSCLLVFRLTEYAVSSFHSMAFSTLICAFVSIGIGNVCYCRTLDDDYKDLRKRIKNMLEPEVKKVLYENLPTREAHAIYYVDYTDDGINYVADTILYCSSRTVSNYRKAGYEKLKRLYQLN